jgi:hypothetical protein
MPLKSRLTQLGLTGKSGARAPRPGFGMHRYVSHKLFNLVTYPFQDRNRMEEVLSKLTVRYPTAENT